MSKQLFGSGRIKHFFRRNGVYLVLTFSLLAVAAVLVSGIGERLVGKTKPQDPMDEPVEQIVTNQPDERTTSTTTSTTPKTQTTTTTETTEAAPQLYVLPLTNTVQKPFSMEAPLYSETMRDWRIHTGVDFAGDEGQTVKATAQGTVTEVKKDALWGGVITIDHGIGVVSRYYGVNPSVKVGDKVKASTPIGKLMPIPFESMQKPHLHFEMTVDGVYVDPIEAIALEVRYADSIHE